MTRPTELLRCVAAIERLCRSDADPTELRVNILRRLRESVAWDVFAWVLTDPRSCVGSAPIADVPDLSMLPDLIRLKYATPVNRWTSLEEVGAQSLHLVTDGRMEESLLWRELLADHAVTDVASAAFWDRYGCWAFLDLWRQAPSAPFSRDEISALRDVVECVTPALRRGQAALFREPASSGLAEGLVVLLLTPALHVVGQTPGTAEYLRALVPPAEGRSPVPASAYNVAAQLLAGEAGIDDHPPWTRTHVTSGVWLTVRAARIAGEQQQAPGTHAGPLIAVTLEQSTPSERTSLYAKSCGFSARETELLDQLVAGADTRTAAKSLFLSQHTVQDHLKSMFGKASVHNRRTMLAHALGA